MIRSIVWALVIVVLVVSGWLVYRQWKGTTNFGSGDVFSRNANADAKDKTEGTYTDLDGKPAGTDAQRVEGNAQRDTATTTYDNDPAAARGAAANQPAATQGTATQAAANGSGTVVTGNAPSTPGPMLRSSADTNSTPVAVPASDSLSANAPDGMRFGGNGRFQWYRQGNLTYRVDTQSGATCVDYATIEEWRKPLVYSHGCRRA